VAGARGREDPPEGYKPVWEDGGRATTASTGRAHICVALPLPLFSRQHTPSCVWPTGVCQGEATCALHGAHEPGLKIFFFATMSKNHPGDSKFNGQRAPYNSGEPRSMSV
jgi:hypothetical protein